MLRISTLSLVAALAVLSPASSHARCASYADVVLTPTVAGPRPRLVVLAIDVDDAHRTPAYELRAASGERVGLTVLASHRGYHQEAVEAVPERPIAPGAYTVRRLDPPAGVSSDALAVTVLAPPKAVDLRPPPDLGPVRSDFQELGCGPAENLVIGISDLGLFFVTLTDEAGHAQSGFVSVEDPLEPDGSPRAIRVGHGMCSGPFSLVDGARYTVTLQAVIGDGRLGPSVSTKATYRRG